MFSTELSNNVIEKMLLKPCKFHVFDGLWSFLKLTAIVLYTSLSLIKWPVLLARALFEPFQGCWAYLESHWFIKVDANLYQFALTKGGCTKIKLMQKAPSSGILHQLHQNY